jgi:hypothetical protein
MNQERMVDEEEVFREEDEDEEYEDVAGEEGRTRKRHGMMIRKVTKWKKNRNPQEKKRKKHIAKWWGRKERDKGKNSGGHESGGWRGENDDKDETGKTARVVTLEACAIDDTGSTERETKEDAEENREK